MHIFIRYSLVFFIFLSIRSYGVCFKKEKDSVQTQICDSNVFLKRLDHLNNQSPMDLKYNEHVDSFIKNYINKNSRLISRMLNLSEYYFPIFEQCLDKYNLPLELKYLSIVESALNPKARSKSGAVGLWQFMYTTGKEYDLKVTSYLDERQDPYKSTEAACIYFQKLYDMFGDWNLVLAAYNGGPGYIKRKINKTGKQDFWSLRPYLRTETRNYVPTFIAMNYIMNYYNEHAIIKDTVDLRLKELDTLTLNDQVSYSCIREMLCITNDELVFLNPQYKSNIVPNNNRIILPSFAVEDYLQNEEVCINFIASVEKKEILIDEQRVDYIVKDGDYLGKIARYFGVKVYEIKKWNNLKTSLIDINDRLVIYVKNNSNQVDNASRDLNVYKVQPGDTLWGIASRFDGLSIWKLKEMNNLDSDNLKPGMEIIIPQT